MKEKKFRKKYIEKFFCKMAYVQAKYKCTKNKSNIYTYIFFSFQSEQKLLRNHCCFGLTKANIPHTFWVLDFSSRPQNHTI